MVPKTKTTNNPPLPSPSSTGGGFFVSPYAGKSSASPKSQSRKASPKPRPHPRPLSHGERGACFIKNKKTSPKPRPHPRPLSHRERGACFIKNKKPSPKPRPHPRPLSHRERGACFIKNKKPSLKPTKSPEQTQHPKPHHLMNCERAVRHRRAALSQFGGRGGAGPPTQKKRSHAISIAWLLLMEAAGVEPASENLQLRPSTCVVFV